MYKNKMKDIRTQQDVTLRELAQITGLSIGYLSHLELGSRKNPSADVMYKISIALKKSISEVFFADGP